MLSAVKEFENYVNNDYKLNQEQIKYNKNFLTNFKTENVKDIYGEPAHSETLTGVISSSFLKKYEEILF